MEIYLVFTLKNIAVHFHRFKKMTCCCWGICINHVKIKIHIFNRHYFWNWSIRVPSKSQIWVASHYNCWMGADLLRIWPPHNSDMLFRCFLTKMWWILSRLNRAGLAFRSHFSSLEEQPFQDRKSNPATSSQVKTTPEPSPIL